MRGTRTKLSDMRFLLLLAFILYDIVAQAKSGYDYDELEGKRQSFTDDRRNWRKKTLDQGDTENVLRGQRHFETGGGAGKSAENYEWSWGKKALEQGNVAENALRGQRHFETGGGAGKSAENYEDKVPKSPTPMNCERPNERYEPCFSGCAAISCDNPRDRLRPCYPFCEPGCVCVPPFVRDDRTHKCVMPDECTKGLKGVPDIGEEV